MRSFTHRLRFLALAAVVAGTASAGQAQDILHVVQGGDLYTVDTSSLVATLKGATGFSQVGGLSFDNVGVLYGIDTSGDNLIIIDKNSGAGSLVGPVGAPVTFSTGLGNDPTTDILYGVTTQGSGFSSFLVTYSKVSGAASGIADTTASAIVGLDFDTSGQLWGIDGAAGADHLIQIDKATGATTIVGPQGLSNLPSVGGLTIGQSGTLWAIDTSNGRVTLFSIDTTTGAPTIAGQITGMSSSVVTGIASERSGCSVDIDLPNPVAGGVNTIVMTCATPNGQVIMAGNKKTGSSPTSVCGLNWGIKNAREFNATANGAGSATTGVFVPAKAAGFSVPIQGLDVTSCTLTSVKMIQF